MTMFNAGNWKVGVVLAAVLSHAAVAVAQVPNPGPAIAAAKAAKAQTEAAQKKNSDALDPQTPPAAQSAPASPQRPQGAEPRAAGDQKPAQGPGYSYDPQGRRDPFVSLLGRGGDVPGASGARPAGLPGLLINEVTLKGVLKSTKGDFIALLQAPDARTYIVRTGDKVMDGKVKAISQDAVVFSQDVNDPLSLVKQREVRKTIRPEAR
jgi:Tfp pilus assembly protein PilP